MIGESYLSVTELSSDNLNIQSPASPDDMVVAHVLVVVEIGREHEIAEQIRTMAGVTEMAVTYGQFDVVAKITSETMADLDRVVTLIRKIPGVLRTSTLVWSV